MSDAKKQKKRMETVIRAAKANLEREQSLLAKMRADRLSAVKQLRERQDIYMDGVSHLNMERLNGNIKSLLTLERGLDATKDKLFEDIREVNYREDQERGQIAMVAEAHTKLKSVEKLQERYDKAILERDQRNEQKQLDELSGQANWMKKL